MTSFNFGGTQTWFGWKFNIPIANLGSDAKHDAHEHQIT